MHYTKFNIDTWARKEHFHVFKNYAQNAFSMTVEIDITEFLAFVKMNNYKFYPAMIHQVATIFNRYPEFRMAMKEDDLIVYDQVNPSYTIAHPEQESFSSIWSEYKNDMAEFLLEYEQDTEKYGDNLSYFPKEHTPDNIFYISALPWVSFMSFSMQFASLQNLFTPIVTLGKYFKRDDRTYLPVAIQLHHAIADGFHAGRFFEDLQMSCKASLNPKLDERESLQLLQSFYGGDGGNRKSEIWFCGMEHGGSIFDNIPEIVTFKNNPEQYQNPSSWQDEEYKESILAAGNLNRYIAYFYAIYANTEEQEAPCNIYYPVKNRILYPDNEDAQKAGIGFKMNMRPLRFYGQSEYERYADLNILPFKTYNEYIEKVNVDRGSFYQEQIREYKPKLIICLGVTEANNYFNFFGCTEESRVQKVIGLEQKEITVEVGRFETTQIMVIPFIGKPSGPNGYSEIFELAKYCQKHFPPR